MDFILVDQKKNQGCEPYIFFSHPNPKKSQVAAEKLKFWDQINCERLELFSLTHERVLSLTFSLRKVCARVYFRMPVYRKDSATEIPTFTTQVKSEQFCD